MSRPYCIAALLLVFGAGVRADDQALWSEFGLLQTQQTTQGKLSYTSYRMKDLTGALAAWEWLRSSKGRPCQLASSCTLDGERTIISEDNYVLVFNGTTPTKAQVTAIVDGLPNKHDSSLPAILTFVPRGGLVPDSARYILGPASLAAFAPELKGTKPGFDQGAEAQVGEYRLQPNGPPLHLALFDYPTPEMARLHATEFKTMPGLRVKRSDVLVAIVSGAASDAEADTLLSRVQYEAKITWNDAPPPSPIRPMYILLKNIMYASLALCALALAAGLMYAVMRIYRRRYGTLESDEAMTTLHLTGE